MNGSLGVALFFSNGGNVLTLNLYSLDFGSTYIPTELLYFSYLFKLAPLH